MNLKEKQIPVIIVLISTLLIIYTTVAKTRYMNEYEVEFLFFYVSYLRALLFLLFTLGAGIFLFLFKGDKDIKAYYKRMFTGNIGTFIKERKITALFLIFCIGLLANTFYGKEIFKYDNDGKFWTKGYKHSIYQETEVPLSLYEVDFLLFRSDYFTALYFSLILIGLALIFFLKITDKQINPFSKAAKEWLKSKFPWKRMSRRDIKNELKVFSKRYMIYLPLLLPVTIFLFLLNYWQKLNESTSPLNVGEAFFLSYGKTFFIIALITGGIGLIKIIAGTGKNQTIRRKQVLVEEEKANESFPITKPIKTQVLSNPKKKLVFEKTEIICLCAVVIFTFLSWVFFSDIFLLQETYESILSINIYNKVLAGDWNLGVGESALFKADLSFATMQEIYGSDAPNVFVGLAVFFAFLFFARHVQNIKENRKNILLFLTGAIVVITTLNFAFVEYTDIKRNEAIQYFYDTAEDLN